MVNCLILAPDYTDYCLIFFFTSRMRSYRKKLSADQNGLCRLRPEPHNELELIRTRDWGQWIISLFRLVLHPAHQRHAAQYDQIRVTVKPIGPLFISRVQRDRTGQLIMMMNWPPPPDLRPNQIGKILCEVLHLSPAIRVIENVQHTLRGQLGVSYPSHVSKISSSGQWCNVTRADTSHALRFLVWEASSQGLRWCVSDVCLWSASGRQRGERGQHARFSTPRPLWHKRRRKKKHSLNFSRGLLSCYTKTALLQKGFAGYS